MFFGVLKVTLTLEASDYVRQASSFMIHFDIDLDINNTHTYHIQWSSSLVPAFGPRDLMFFDKSLAVDSADSRPLRPHLRQLQDSNSNSNNPMEHLLQLFPCPS